MVPDFDQDDDNTQLDESAEPISSPLVAPAPDGFDSSPSANSSPVNPSIQQYLKAKNPQTFQDAQAQVQRNNEATDLSSALVQLGHGLSRAGGQADLSGIQAMAKNNNAPVQNFEAQQDNDPNSLLAQQLRALYKPLLSKAGLDPSVLDNLGASQIKSHVQNPLEFFDKQKTLESNRQLALQAQQDRASLAAQGRQDKLDDKATAEQNKAYTQMRHDLETFRGNTAAQQASQKILNAQTALSIVQNKDPNTLTTQDLNLLADEMGKVATGGVPGEGSIKALVPNTYQTKLAEMKSFLMNKPSDAQAGEFIRHNMDYLKDMSNVAQSTLDSYRTNIAKGYKNRVSPNDFQEAMNDYNLGSRSGATQADPGASPAAQGPGSSAPHGGKYPPGSTVSVKGKNYVVGPDGDSLVPQ